MKAILSIFIEIDINSSCQDNMVFIWGLFSLSVLSVKGTTRAETIGH